MLRNPRSCRKLKGWIFLWDIPFEETYPRLNLVCRNISVNVYIHYIIPLIKCLSDDKHGSEWMLKAKNSITKKDIKILWRMHGRTIKFLGLRAERRFSINFTLIFLAIFKGRPFVILGILCPNLSYKSLAVTRSIRIFTDFYKSKSRLRFIEAVSSI